MNPTTWPSQENCTTITISKYTESRDQAESTKTIDDQSTIDTIFMYLHTIPAHGDEIKMGDVSSEFPLTVIECNYPDETRTIEIFDDKLKTPSNGFVTLECDVDNEKIFVDYIQSIV